MIAVIVVYKNGSDFRACVQQLSKINTIRRIIVVDNSYHEIGSCISEISEVIIDKLSHIIPPYNLGYSGGNNFGIKSARGFDAKKILVCNPDVFIDSEALIGLTHEMTAKSIHLLSPFMVEPDTAGDIREFRLPGWDLWLGRGVLQIPPGAPRGRFLPSFYGACFIADVEVFDDVGPLSEDFFLYCEEIDYCLRMKDSDFRWGISDNWGVNHDRGSSISPAGSPGKSAISLMHSSRSAIILGRKYWPVRVVIWTTIRIAWSLSYIIRGNISSGKAILSGLREGWLATVSISASGNFEESRE